ncbi:MAG: nickel pincer cofactor biosynthesis protein LarB [Planctomycetes bacterium]|nr:nickel pincer cofactor biosynthesis protein LarB [Planctomycetota bacterium]MCB9909640.1 nickel pincer cofactor biosynthesis protein LarB [Planctomycetota bacterium]MCB9911871.1 nickel pincer cofactor biosynthesis protein LarB [Planctomycetota bacterium]HPF12690.1 nickel pincer cofactor biosynthesis protein LarB [Planctomycetota bacterium]HRV80365.1 nickel pincer cofactor biosynthesis protein LarB [Planctomycetota bacterium]
MEPSALHDLLQAVRAGDVSLEHALNQLKGSAALDLGHSQLDLHRSVRCGHPEVVFGAGKRPAELVEIAQALVRVHGRLLVTRCSPEGAQALQAGLPECTHHERARAVTVGLPEPDQGEGSVLVVCAGTSDLPVAEEAWITARSMGARASVIADVGVAGLHRVLARLPHLREARALVVVAGMEGALPSVVGGLVDRPVIAVPTSIGYGAAFGGLAALLGMLNSCAAGVTVVNIDNGFGAGYAAAQINRLGSPPAPSAS